MAYTEPKTIMAELAVGEVREIQDVLRNLPYYDFKVTVEPMGLADYKVEFYWDEIKMDEAARTNSRYIERWDCPDAQAPTQPNANWVDQKRGEYVPGPRAKVIITNEATSVPMTFRVTFLATMESGITF
jgi:hypothetical protein